MSFPPAECGGPVRAHLTWDIACLLEQPVGAVSSAPSAGPGERGHEGGDGGSDDGKGNNGPGNGGEGSQGESDSGATGQDGRAEGDPSNPGGAG